MLLGLLKEIQIFSNVEINVLIDIRKIQDTIPRICRF